MELAAPVLGRRSAGQTRPVWRTREEEVNVGQVNINPGGGDGGESAAAAGINLITVLIVLAVLVALVAVIFWGLPNWFGSSTINVNIRS